MMTGFLFERLTRVAPLGLRFWDTVTGTLVTTGLRVVAAPRAHPSRTVEATMGPSGVYGFHHLPSLRTLEFGAGDADFWHNLTPTDHRPFMVTVVDIERRFQPFKLSVTAPVRGLLGLSCPGTTVTPNIPATTIPLFSTPIRSMPAGSLAIVYTELRDTTGQPCAWAMVEARQVDNTVLGYGMADETGRIAVMFPYPTSLTPDTPLLLQAWPIQLVGYSASLPGETAADLCDVLKQPQTPLAPLPNGPVTIRFGQVLHLR